MRQDRAESIARALNDTDKWHSHGHGISMDILKRDLNLRIEDLEADAKQCATVKQYCGLLADYMQKRAHGGVLHTVQKYLPFALA